MSDPKRREFVLSLLALAYAPAAARAAEPSPLPARLLPGLKVLREAYVARHPEAADPQALARDLLPQGWNVGARARLRTRIAADFRAGRVFDFRGWRLADTEGRIYALVGA